MLGISGEIMTLIRIFLQLGWFPNRGSFLLCHSENLKAFITAKKRGGGKSFDFIVLHYKEQRLLAQHCYFSALLYCINDWQVLHYLKVCTHSVQICYQKLNSCFPELVSIVLDLCLFFPVPFHISYHIFTVYDDIPYSILLLCVLPMCLLSLSSFLSLSFSPHSSSFCLFLRCAG